MKLVFAGLWVTAVALGTAYGVALYLPGASDAAKAAAPPPPVLQSQKTRVINVPMVIDGALRGFMAAQFVFTEDSNVLKTLQVPPDVYLLDEAFRAIYSDTALDPHHVERYDLQKLTARLVKGTNDRLGAPLIKDVLIENFSYIDKDVTKG
ncbi:hypothetical protein D3273_08180 [Lichenibacterium minor]|uniref:Flagellar basal body-associated protein FliL n=1 Tax=Lichenibacterium minor TaxID=2316528 RepID=A0A4Q2UAX5_9HYPH|nr:hypothetical protein [Lichenibacterium minor]RYC32361.1 hypothetical protein D3273_08180 [Lichenibacterium minor]